MGKKFQLPEWVNKEDWDAFVAMRRKIKKPMTDRAKTMAINVLRRLKDIGEDPNECLKQSEYFCWQGIFPIGKQYRDQMGMNDNKARQVGDF